MHAYTFCNHDRIKRLAVLLLFLFVSGCTGPARTTTPEPSHPGYSFWPVFPAEPHVQFLTSYRYSSDIEPPASGLETLIYGKSSGALPIQKPYGVEMQDGRVYVCDIRNAAVFVLDLRKQQTRLMGTTGNAGLVQPTDIAISRTDGMIYVSDIRRGVIFVFDKAERHIASLGHDGMKPAGIAVHGDTLYVTDFQTLSVLVLDRRTGEVRRTIGGPGGEDGQFVRPLGIDVDNEGNIYVADVLKCRLQKFSPEGRLLKATGRISDTAGSFVRPKHVAVDREGIVYVVDAAFDNVQVFNDQGQVLMFFGSGGAHPGSMDLPAGICVHEGDLDLFREYIHPDFNAERLLIVTNQFGPQKVSVYAMGQLREGRTIADLGSQLAPMGAGVVDDSTDNPLTNDAPSGTASEEPVNQETAAAANEPPDRSP